MLKDEGLLFLIDLTDSILTDQSEGILIYSLVLALWSPVSVFLVLLMFVCVESVSHTEVLGLGNPFLTFLRVFFILPNTWGNLLISLYMLNMSTFSCR